MQKIKLNSQVEVKLLNNLFNDFIYVKQTEKLAKDSISYYQRCYKSFVTEMGISDDFKSSDLTTSLILEYTNKLLERDGSEQTVNTLLRGLRTFVNYCIEWGNTPANCKVKMINAGEPLKHSYTMDELSHLLKKPNMKKCDFVEYRSWVMVNTFYGTGQRLSTVLDLKVKDIVAENGLIMFYNNKSKRNNPVPLSSDLGKILNDYIYTVGLKEDDFVFCNQFGNKLAKRSAQDAIADYNKSRGVLKTSIHLFRHTFAKDWIMNGGDIFRLQSILGHSTLEIVKMYVRLYAPDLKVDFDNFSPLDNMRERLNIQEKQKIRTRSKD